MSPSLLFDPDTLMQATELQVVQDEYRHALQEPPWDGYCGLVKVSEDDPAAKPVSVPSSAKEGAISIPDSISESHEEESTPHSPLGVAPPGMQFAEQSANQPAAVTVGYSSNRDASEQLLLKLHSLQAADDLSHGGRNGQRCRIAEEAFSSAVQLLEKGQVPPAINLLKVAQAACPSSKPQAQSRIILLLARCQEMTAPKMNVQQASQQATPGTSAPAAASAGPLANGTNKHSQSEVKPTDSDAKKAETAFEQGLASLQRGDMKAATENLQESRKWCPRNQTAALIKVQRLLNLIAVQES